MFIFHVAQHHHHAKFNKFKPFKELIVILNATKPKRFPQVCDWVLVKWR
jgi:hypothetical protein